MSWIRTQLSKLGNVLQDRARRLFKRLRRPRGFTEKFRQKGAFGTDIPYNARFRTLRWLYRIGAGLLAVLLVSCAVLGVSYVWLVTDVRVEGTVRYRAEDIREIAGIQTGDLMLGFYASGLENTLLDRFPLLADVSVDRSLNGTVTVTVREEDKLFYTQHYRNYYLISAATLRVIAVEPSPDVWRGYSPVYIGLPEQARMRVGDTLRYEFLPYPAEGASGDIATYEVETGTPAEEFAYVGTVRSAVMDSALGTRVTGLELSDKYDLWFLLDGKIQVRLGGTDSLAYKLEQAATVLARQPDPAGRAVLDASDPAAITYREDPALVLPAWAGQSSN